MYEEVPPSKFISTLMVLMKRFPRLKENIDLHKESEYKKTFLSKTRLSGVAVTKDDEVVNVFNIEQRRGLAPTLLKLAKSAGGSHLNAFDGPLVKIYKDNGFVEYKREKNWTDGGPDVVFMKLPTNESTKQLHEVKMSPSVFSKGLVKAQGKGGLIGFEFEIVVPIHSTGDLKIQSVEWKKKRKFEDFLKWVTLSTGNSLPEETATKIKEQYLSWAKEQTKDTLKSLSEEGLDKLETLYSEVYTKPSLNSMTEFITTGSPTAIQKVLVDFLELEDYVETEDYETLSLHYQVVSRISNFVDDVYGSIDRFFKILNLTYRSPEGGNELYLIAARQIKPVIESEVAETPVHLIDIAKTVQKNLTDWYLEPDATIKPNKAHEEGVEVVSPPMAVSSAMESLKRFYTACKRYGYYTNSSTGLHINISLPEKFDMLKLILFLGDKYVLKSFGRESSGMAKSVLDSIRKGKTVNNIDELTPDTIKRLMLSVDWFVDDHYASISFETNPDTLKRNKYVSFRHAGGDYLNELQKIEDTIGRFVTAMLIASDPNAHKEEYVKKLYKLVKYQEEQ